ncbi:ABC transporter ATP-binding protein [Bradyrhizobium prioriisuperbiae]|uniref:ABC transporter ATP-binding protein n=1 Tax=Bradyrhizobium prioriisuperbiae TaxID=2854389 RepID=UPI0028ECC414|nr:ABC transporter ATP-binding protein [Bradyrhizobium prioritasuperba]
MNTIDLTVESLSTGYPGRPIIGNLSLGPIRPGEIAAIVGPNAAGKSTLLRALAGLLPATGQARLAGKNILPLPARVRAEMIGFMPQSLPQTTDLTVLEAMLSALHLARPSPHDPLAHAIDTLAQVGIADIALQPLHTFSGGQRQLASLAQSIVRRPQLLLLDEPTSALDLGHQFDVMRLVRNYVGDDRIAIVVLHDLAFAARWADNIIMMERGALKIAGPPEVAITPEMLARVYGVEARVERYARGALQVIVDDRVAASSVPNPPERKL